MLVIGIVRRLEQLILLALAGLRFLLTEVSR
jgi:hypothetical protein